MQIESLETRAVLAAGLSALGNQYWHQEVPNVLGDADDLGEFGQAVASGDFNRDGFRDLVVGSPGDTVEDVAQAGAINVLYGARLGLGTFGNQYWSQGRGDILSDLEPGDRFGSALAVGDFNGDRIDDLAIGAPRDSVNQAQSAGMVNIIYGSPNIGLASTNNQFFSQDTSGMNAILNAGALFGQALVAGDFDRDGFDDLAIGAPGDSVQGAASAGSVSVIYGSSTGLTTDGDQFLTQGADAAVNDRFGSSLAVGDFNRDGFADLAIGVPGETVSGQTGAGAVNVIHGSANGLTVSGNQIWNRDVELVEGGVRNGAAFGEALAAGDFNRDGFADLAIGVPNDPVLGQRNAGSVNVIPGSNTGLTATGSQLWRQSDLPSNTARNDDRFGASLIAGDFDGSSRRLPNVVLDDLAIGAPGDAIPQFATNRAGLVNVLYGSTLGLQLAGAQTWYQGAQANGDQVQGVPISGETFGRALASGDFDNNGFWDLAVGVPMDTVGSPNQKFGAVNTLYASDIQLPPVASDDSAATDAGEPVTIDVLANDFDDGSIDPTSVTITASPANGTTLVDPTSGQVAYTPNAGFIGGDQFIYTVRDNEGLVSNQATVRVTVRIPNMPPVANDDDESTSEDTPARFVILDNDTDSDGTIDPSTVAITDAPTRGLATVNAVTGEVTYTPFTNVFGSDEFRYTVRDDDGRVSNTATVRVTINSINDPPSAMHDRAETLENVAVPINVLANDSDIDGSIDPTSVTIVSNPSNGMVSVDAATGIITYTPDPGFVGADTFGYTVEDDQNAVSATALVRVTVRRDQIPLAANDDARSTGMATPVVIDILANDTGSIRVDSVQITTAPSNGTTSVDPSTGMVTYTPANGFAGVDEVRYTVRDESNALSNIATVTLTVAGWRNPVNRLDVNNDGFVAPLDALLVINEINAPEIIEPNGAIRLNAKDPASPFLDVNGDNFIVPFDALLVINCLNARCATAAAAVSAPLDARQLSPLTANRADIESRFSETRRAIAAVFDQVSNFEDDSRKTRGSLRPTTLGARVQTDVR